MDLWKKMRKDHQEMLKSWAKVFLAAVATLWLAGEGDLEALWQAGLAAVIPLVITWLDPTDYRFGKMKEVPKPVKTPAKKSTKSTK